MQVSGNDAAILLDNAASVQTDELFEVLNEISQKLDGAITLSLRLTDQIDLVIALIVTIVFCAVCYVILKSFSRF